MIINLTIPSGISSVAIFCNGMNALISDLFLINFKSAGTTTSGSFCGGLFAGCTSCTFNNVHFNVSNASLSNTIKGIGQVGAFVGALTGGNFTNCSLTNTYINGDATSSVGEIGGFIGLVCGTTYMTNCHNNGFPSNPSTHIIDA